MPPMATPLDRRLVVRTAKGDDGICGIRTEETFPSHIVTASGIVAQLVRITDRYVLYQEMAASA